jgi:excisionase family DNA binding protein
MAIGVLSTDTPSARRVAKRLASVIDGRSELEHQLRKLLGDLAAGESFLVLKADEELTPAQAAEVLGVTRQYVDRLLEDEVLNCRRLPGSSHRRLKAADVVALRERQERMRTGRRAIAGLLGED